MRNNNNIFSITHIKNCEICEGHFKPLHSTHKFCSACYYGIRQAQAIAVAVKCKELSKCPQ